jgi:hypothetical protein
LSAAVPHVESLRGQALRMVANWAAEVEALQMSGQHPLDVVRELQLTDNGKRRRKIDPKGANVFTLTARGVESKRFGKVSIKIRELTPEARRADKIMRHVSYCDSRYFLALQLAADMASLRDVATFMRRSVSDTARLREGGLAIFTSCLVLKLPS